MVVLGDDDAVEVEVAVPVVTGNEVDAVVDEPSGIEGLLGALDTEADPPVDIEIFLDPDERPFSNFCSALGVLVSFLTECFRRPMRPLLELGLALVGETVDEGVEEPEGGAVEVPELAGFDVGVAVAMGPCFGDSAELAFPPVDACCVLSCEFGGAIDCLLNVSLEGVVGSAAGDDPFETSDEVVTVGPLLLAPVANSFSSALPSPWITSFFSLVTTVMGIDVNADGSFWCCIR